ncbi:hypothetical protein O1611_g4867 [Lasiodiplodia mahajangana]|uniref:Uncharacterized protein n=1 Tax=Lasiodiplodia mahajangana TaxID=1108764 RepID=A0ACC2JMM6_9PEZI|nr:hypothetical protein O1611_g4867 [Lasiodiplodia mahajangana]
MWREPRRIAMPEPCEAAWLLCVHIKAMPAGGLPSYDPLGCRAVWVVPDVDVFWYICCDRHLPWQAKLKRIAVCFSNFASILSCSTINPSTTILSSGQPYTCYEGMRFLTAVGPPLAVWALGIPSLVRASTVLTYSDQDCTDLSKTITAKDSTGSGDCTKLPTGFGSFMIKTLGDGCSVTIYGSDAEDSICSATNNSLAETSVCYNSTWIYFSIDDCTDESSISTFTPTSKSTLATSITSTVSTTATTGTSSSILATAIVSTTSDPSSSTTSTSTTTAAPSSNGVNVGAVVGGTISGVFVVAVLGGAAFYFFWFRPKHQMQLAELSGRPDTASTRNNDPFRDDNAFAKSDPYPKNDPYVAIPGGHEVYELSPQYIAEVHEQTHERHELPP